MNANTVELREHQALNNLNALLVISTGAKFIPALNPVPCGKAYEASKLAAKYAHFLAECYGHTVVKKTNPKHKAY